MVWIVTAVSGLGAGTGALLGGALSLGGSLIQGNAAQSAASTQAGSQQAALNQQLAMFNQLNQQSAPFRQAGYTSLNQLLGGTAGQVPTFDQSGNITGYTQGNQSFTRPFTAQDLNSYLAPNYQFMLNQGLGANTQNVNVGGGGSNVARANQVFAENYAGNAYQNAFNNYQAQQSNIFNRLASLAGLGQSSAATSQGAGTQAGQYIGNTLGNIGTAQAAGQIGAANALSGGFGSAGNYALLSSLLGGSPIGTVPTGQTNGFNLPA